MCLPGARSPLAFLGRSKALGEDDRRGARQRLRTRAPSRCHSSTRSPTSTMSHQLAGGCRVQRERQGWPASLPGEQVERQHSGPCISACAKRRVKPRPLPPRGRSPLTRSSRARGRPLSRSLKGMRNGSGAHARAWHCRRPRERKPARSRRTGPRGKMSATAMTARRRIAWRRRVAVRPWRRGRAPAPTSGASRMHGEASVLKNRPVLAADFGSRATLVQTRPSTSSTNT